MRKPNELGLFLKMQAYLQCIVKCVVNDAVMKNVGETWISKYSSRIALIRKSRLFPYIQYTQKCQRQLLSLQTSSNEGLASRFKSEGLCVKSIYDIVFELKFGFFSDNSRIGWSECDNADLEKLYSSLELLTKDNANALHLLVALYSLDVDLAWLCHV